MPYPSIADPVPATVITAAWEIANPLAAVRWLRQLMGNADPPAGSLALISSSPTTGSWAKVPADALAPGAVVSHLTYTPVNQAGDTMTGDLAAPGFAAGAHGVNGGAGGVNGAAGGVNGGTGGYSGGSTSVGVPSMLGLSVGAQGVGVTGAGGVNVAGGGPIQGGNKAVGANLQVVGLQVGVNGILSDALISAPNLAATAGGIGVSGGGGVVVTGGGGVTVSGGGGVTVGGSGGYNGGSTSVGDASVLGLSVGDHGLAIHGPLASTAPAGSPFTAVSPAVCTGVNADMTDGAHASVTPGAGRIPIADAAGKLDAWISASGLAGVPSNLIAFVAIAAQIPTGWLRYATMDGLMPVGAGTTFGVTFTENNGYGSSWSHGHADGGVHAHSGSPFTISGTTGAASGSGNQANVATPNPASATQAHTHDQGSLDIAGNTANNGAVATSSDRWIIPCRALVYVIKT